MDSIKYTETNKIVDKKKEEKFVDIVGPFSDFDRIFHLQEDQSNQDSLLLFSRRKQLFTSLNLENKQMSTLNIKVEKEYQQVEYYDKKIFCINKESLTMDVFFPSRRQQLYHKMTFCFANRDMKLKENFCLMVWMHCEKGILYRCLLGPFEDGRYMNFDLLERYFDYKSNNSQMIGRVIFVSLALDSSINTPQDVVCAMDEVKKSIICFAQESNKFFEYNDFCGEGSILLDVMYNKKILQNRLKKMYFYYPYDFFPQKVKNQLKTAARNVPHKVDIETFVRNRYREVLLCVEGHSLLKMNLLESAALANMNFIWKIEIIDTENAYVPIDITINKNTGKIYCLCEQGIQILKHSGRDYDDVKGREIARRKSLYETNYIS